MADAVSGLASETPIQFHLVHAVRGRTRLRVDPPHRPDDLASAIADLFRDHPGLREIRLNEDCQSVVVIYDPEVLRIDDLLAEQVPEPAWASWVPSRLVAATQRLDAWRAEAVRTGESVLDELWELWSARRDQMSALMSRWRASSVVARIMIPAQSAPPSGEPPDGAASRR